ncbi:hypothetical protein BKA66DRAFT_606758 [Pyrenochaeta sp. MPI-SDFR-AT-0127]|nr:hypothetical protein BKA66DRAFT_606758 [Pyrenochaeta sp. MPI-SDFR-AT-0127]
MSNLLPFSSSPERAIPNRGRLHPAHLSSDPTIALDLDPPTLSPSTIGFSDIHIPSSPLCYNPATDFVSSPALESAHPLSPSWLSNAAKPSVHIVKPSPETRQKQTTFWVHGVLSGGMLIDILEYLSATQRPIDWGLSLWLQENYIAPFGRVERLDGLVVASMQHRDMITLAHEWYIDFTGERAKVQRLWVPGLEPTYNMNREKSLKLPSPPRRFEQTVWRASDMYYQNGVERKRKGRSLGEWKDELGWERKIWMAGQNGRV